MNQPVLIPKNSFTRLQWKNGLGYTDQIGIFPEGADLRAGNYDWRISTASIARASDFSLFPDHDRALVVLDGVGLRLFHKDGDFEDSVELPPFEVYEFPGDICSRCELVDGPVQDLSVFFRKGVTEASVEIVHPGADTAWNWAPRGRWNFLFAARGNFEICTHDDVTETFTQGDAFFLSSDSPQVDWGFPVVPHAGKGVFVSISFS